MNYSQMIGLIKNSQIHIDRKLLSELAVYNTKSFAEIIKQARSNIS